MTVTENSGPIGSVLSTVWKTEDENQPPCTDPCLADTQESGPTVSVLFNLFHGGELNFVNVPVVQNAGCTATLGFWKNHTKVWPAPFSPNATFFRSGQTWIFELNAPPKGGDAYLILAHQYIAAALNIASGAGVPPDVQTAFNDATTFFMTGVGSDPIGWSNTLDNYNNGLAAGGPSHCN